MSHILKTAGRLYWQFAHRKHHMRAAELREHGLDCKIIKWVIARDRHRRFPVFAIAIFWALIFTIMCRVLNNVVPAGELPRHLDCERLVPLAIIPTIVSMLVLNSRWLVGSTAASIMYVLKTLVEAKNYDWAPPQTARDDGAVREKLGVKAGSVQGLLENQGRLLAGRCARLSPEPGSSRTDEKRSRLSRVLFWAGEKPSDQQRINEAIDACAIQIRHFYGGSRYEPAPIDIAAKLPAIPASTASKIVQDLRENRALVIATVLGAIITGLISALAVFISR